MRLILVVAAMAGCGRYGFEARTSGDGSVDAPGSDATDASDEPLGFVKISAPGFAAAATASATIDQGAGHLLVAAVYWDQAPNIVTLTDTAGLAWTSAPKYEIPSGCGGSTGNATGAQLYYAQTTSSMTNTVTASQTSGTQPLGVMVAEYAGVAMANPVEIESGQVAPAVSNAIAVPAFTTTATDLVVVFFNETQLMGSMTAGSGYIAEALDTGFPNLYEDALVAPGSQMPTGTLPVGQSDACWVGDALALRGR